MVDSVNNNLGSVKVQTDRPQQKELAKTQGDGLPQQQPPASEDVNVQLSNEAAQLTLVKEAIANEPEVRDERVAQIRQQIVDGELKVNAQNIALQLILE